MPCAAMCLAAKAFVPSTFLYGSLCSHSVDHWTRSLFSTCWHSEGVGTLVAAEIEVGPTTGVSVVT